MRSAWVSSRTGRDHGGAGSSAPWWWWPERWESVCEVSRETRWGEAFVEVASGASQRLYRVPADELLPLAQRRWRAEEVVWRAAATRAWAAAAAGEALGLCRGRVTLLPHQRAALDRASAGGPVRLCLCDEVGLGKTVTAGAIFAELKARGLIRRTLVVAPKGVQRQWVAEMADRFQEEFVRVGPEGVPLDAGFDPWRAFSQVVCSFDAVKPVRQRAGWSRERVDAANQTRFGALVDAGWDLVILDEAHHLAGASDEVARHRLGRELARTSPNILVLSATPHSGKSDGFRRFLGLADASFLDDGPLTRVSVAQRVVRTDKRLAVDHQGQRLFRPRHTQLEGVPYGDRTVERTLYEAVTAYVREGYGRAVRERRPSVAFLVLLMQRLVSSSTAAIRTTLERRLAVLTAAPAGDALDWGFDADDWDNLTGDEQREALGEIHGPLWVAEHQEVVRLLDLARQAESAGPDAKALHFLDVLRRIQGDEGNSGVKVLVFTEFVPTQRMVCQLLANAGVTVVALNGSMDQRERAEAVARFQENMQVMVSTDAGGEGINLQFAHVVVNWDLPWAPTRLEQRIGRVDRIGQVAPVRVYNLVAEHSVDARVLEVLEEKLAVILTEFGADKRGDILESLDRETEALYAGALAGDAALVASANDLLRRTRTELTNQTAWRDLLPNDQPVHQDRRELLPAAVRAAAGAWTVLFSQALADPLMALEHVSGVAPGEPVPTLTLAGSTAGWWAAWEVAGSQSRDEPGKFQRTALALFVDDEGRLRPDLVDTVWERLIDGSDLADSPAGIPATIPSLPVWTMLANLADDHAYQPSRALLRGRDDDAEPPALRAVLVVRVTP